MTRNRKLPTVRRKTILAILKNFDVGNEQSTRKYLFRTGIDHCKDNPHLHNAYMTLQHVLEDMMGGLGYKQNIRNILEHVVFIEYECVTSSAP